MAQTDVIEAVKTGDLQTIERLISRGASVNEQDEHGWTPLNWAAGKGDVRAVSLLLERGADVTLTGRDNRTPLMIAKAAGRDEVTDLLTEAARRLGVWEDPRTTREYCKAYYAADLQRFADEQGNGDRSLDALMALPNDQVVYVHQDFTVTKSMWHGEDVLVGDVTPEWQAFCESTLGFEIPADLL
jgi:hypothetical protein